MPMEPFAQLISFTRPLLWLLPLFLLGAILKLPAVKGWFGERLVIRRGEKTLPAVIYRSFHDVTLQGADGTTQIDHIYVSIFGIFVVETKHMTGWIFGREHDPQWTQQIFRHRVKFQNPLRQNVRHMKALESLLQLPPRCFHSVVVFSSHAELKSGTQVGVCTLRDFDAHIRSFKAPVLSSAEADDVCEQIAAGRLARSSATHKAHVADLHRRHGGKASVRQDRFGWFLIAMDAGLGVVLVKLVVGFIIVLCLTGVMTSVLRPFQRALGGGAMVAPQPNLLPVPQQTPGSEVLPPMNQRSPPALDARPTRIPAHQAPTAAEVRESKRQADEASRILERSTPEL
jgi:restriction system protein